jgi:DNA (cytosine-5)-methyltransferase 1
MDKKITVNSFFAGIGGFDLGFEKMGFKTIFQCEINDFCVNILNKHWPDLKLARDISNLKPREIPKADIWCGGFPCQDVSVARGSKGREGLKGKNSGLFYEFLGLIEKKRPEVLLIENVTGLLNSHDGNDFKIIIQSLTALGYGVSWRVLNTRYFGAPQSRPRVYICAWKGNLEKAVYTLHEYEASVKPKNAREGFIKANRNHENGAIVPQISYCLAATSGRHTGTDWSRTYISYYNKVRRLTPNESEKLQGFPAGWTIPEKQTSKKNTLDLDSLRYHSVGNAVSVPVVVWIANRIKQIKNEKIINKGIQSILKKFADFSDPKTRTQFFSELNSKELFADNKLNKIKWSSGGLAYGDKIVDFSVHHCPTLSLESNLLDIIEIDSVDEKYFISSSAARGIIRRVDSQNRELFLPLRKALERLSKIKDSFAEIK